MLIFFWIIWSIENSEEQHLFEIEIFCDNVANCLYILINLMHVGYIRVLIAIKISYCLQTFEQ